MAPIAIRRLQNADLEAVVGVWVRARWDSQPWLEERMQHSPEDDLRYFRDTIRRTCEVWVAVEADAIVGLLALAPARRRIEQLYVEPGRQRHGIGTALLDHAKRLLPDGLGLFTHQRNARARAFYESRGLRAVAFGVSPPPESEPDVEYAWTPGADGEG